MSRWFRFYEEAVNDDKVRGLSSDTLRWQWVKLLVVASKYEGCIPSLKAAALNLGVNESKAAQVVGALATAGLLDSDEQGYFRAHNWNGRQPTDATAAERMRRYRQNHRNNRNAGTVTTVTQPVTVTPLEREIEEETEKKESKIPALRAAPDASTPGRKRKKAPLGSEWKPPQRAYDLAGSLGLQVAPIEAHFRDYLASSGRQYVDYDAGFCNFVRNARKFGNGTNGGNNGKTDTGNIAPAFDGLIERIRSFDRTPTVRSGEGEADVRLLSKG